MATLRDVGSLAPESSTLSPIPSGHRTGLIVISVFACLSFVSATTIFLHLTVKLVSWHLKVSRNKRTNARRQRAVDLSLGLDQRHFGRDGSQVDNAELERARGQLNKIAPNQFVVLIYNLFLADIQQSMAFLLNTVWVGNNAIQVGTTTCWAQGWFVCTGDLSSSCFITAIAFHTYLTVVRGYKPPQWALYVTIVGLWIFIYLVSIIGIAKTSNGRDHGGYFVRAAAWCWINEDFENIRLVTHYLFIFISLGITSIIYIMIFFNLRSRPSAYTGTAETTASPNANSNSTPNSKLSLEMRTTNAAAPAARQQRAAEASGHHPGFLIYPIIYVICTLPLALGRIATMAGASVPISYFCAAGTLIVSNGWLDVLLWGTTRRSLIFGPVDNADALGLDTFAFMLTPSDRRYGNMIWVQGNNNGEVYSTESANRAPFWKRMLGLGSGGVAGRDHPLRHGGHRRTGERSISQESLRGAGRGNELGNAIQMDTVTSVVVEIDPEEGSKNRRPRRHPSATSMNSSEKGVNSVNYQV